MNAPLDIVVLISEISEGREVSSRIYRLIAEHYASLPREMSSRTFKDSIVLADLLSRLYTCAETYFLRIARFFGNGIDPDKWHSDLLKRMAGPIEGVRPTVISSKPYAALDELRRFRHFHRYYFEMDYEWQRLEFLMSMLEDAWVPYNSDMDAFVTFLRQLAEPPPAP